MGSKQSNLMLLAAFPDSTSTQWNTTRSVKPSMPFHGLALDHQLVSRKVQGPSLSRQVTCDHFFEVARCLTTSRWHLWPGSFRFNLLGHVLLGNGATMPRNLRANSRPWSWSSWSMQKDPRARGKVATSCIPWVYIYIQYISKNIEMCLVKNHV